MAERTAEKKDYPVPFLQGLGELEKKIGYTFADKKYLVTALTHSSFSKEKKNRIQFAYNERLEFLGDSVLSVVVSEEIFRTLTDCPEGALTKIRAATVCAETLYEFAEEIELGRFMLVNHGLEETGGRHLKNVLADCFEALIAGIYLDGGMDAARDFILRFARPKLARITLGGFLHDEDYKSLLQQKVQTSPGERVDYVLVGEKGPDHKKEFTMEARLNSNVLGTGTGSSKREAEQAAAKAALENWFGE